jgi:pimeloyl-ACP methyl ester carboxylesterase
VTEPTLKKAKGDGIEIQVALWEGTGKQIICAHGITANSRSWDVVASAVSPKHRVIAMDLRGRGRSDKPSTGYSLDHHLRDIKSLMEDLGIERAVLMGHSLGAFISLAFAARYPERTDRIVLFDGGGKLSQEQLDAVFAAIQPALDRLGKVYPSSDVYIEEMKSAPYIQPWSQAIENYYRYELKQVKGGVECNIDPSHIKEEAANIRKVEVDQFYPQVPCRVLILRATVGIESEADLLLPEPVIERMMKEIPRARRVDITGANHYAIVFQPNEKRDRSIMEFLEE